MKSWPLLLPLLLAGCATPEPPAPPDPAPLPTPVVCAPGAGMTEIETAPLAPRGDYTQRDVARYIAGLHLWGSRGWEKLHAVREWSRDCVDGTAVRDGGHAE